MESKNELKMLEEVEYIIYDFSQGYMNSEIPESQIYSQKGKEYKDYIKKVSTIRTFFKVIKRKLRVLSIIKNKKVNISVLLTAIDSNIVFENSSKLDFYNNFSYSLELTQEEFDLLREEFKK